jgi:dTMP kinase
MPERGKYIVLEGSDGTGKSTQAFMLDGLLRLAGNDTLQVFNYETDRMEPLQEPGGTSEADAIRLWLKDKSVIRTPWEDVEAFTNARAYSWNDVILPALEAGKHAVTSRSWLSTLAYQGYGDGISIDEIEDLTRNRVGDGYMNPDFVAILAVQNASQLRNRLTQRGGEDLDAFESKPDAFQTSMKSGYIRLAEDRGIDVIDASRSKFEVFQDILKRVAPLFESK